MSQLIFTQEIGVISNSSIAYGHKDFSEALKTLILVHAF